MQASLDLTAYVEQRMPRSAHEQDEERSSEAYYCRRMEFAATVVSTIRERIFKRVRLTCSAGRWSVRGMHTNK